MGTINKILGKINKAKSSINSLKGISSKLKSLGYTSEVDKLGEQAEKARVVLGDRRRRLADSLASSSGNKGLLKNRPTDQDIEYIYPIHDRLDNYLVFTTRPRQNRQKEGGEKKGDNIFSKESVEIMLYVPTGHSSAQTVDYKKDGIGQLVRGATAMYAGEGIGKGIDGVLGAIQAGFQSMINAGSGGLVNFVQGQAKNPMEEQMLEGVPIREFNFEYIFWPKSQAEADEVNNIIYTFRTAMLPDTFGSKKDGDSENYFNYPNIFDVEWEGPIADVVEGFLPMVCTKCDVDHFNGQKAAFFTGGQPISTKMSLSFKELKAMTQETYQIISPNTNSRDIGTGTPAIRGAIKPKKPKSAGGDI